MANKKIKHIVAKLLGETTEETLDIYDESALHATDIVDNLTSTDATKVLSAKQGKALNDSIGNLTSFVSTARHTDCTNWNSGISFVNSSYFNLYKHGKIVFLSSYINIAANISGYALLCNLPSGYAPYFEVEIPLVRYASGTIEYAYLSTNGAFYSRHDIVKENLVIISTSWPIS